MITVNESVFYDAPLRMAHRYRHLLRRLLSQRRNAEVARKAEDAGASSIWFAQHMGYRDAIVCVQDKARPPTRSATYSRGDQSLSVAAVAGCDGDCIARRARAEARGPVRIGRQPAQSRQSGWDKPATVIRTMREYMEALRALREREPCGRTERFTS